MYFHQLDNTHYTGSCQYSTPPPRPRPRRVKETRTNKPAFAASTPASINAGPTALNVFLLSVVDHCDLNIRHVWCSKPTVRILEGEDLHHALLKADCTILFSNL